MSKERARRREERARTAAVAEQQRRAEAVKRARRQARRAAARRLMPAQHSRQTGPLAEKRRRERGGTFAVLLAVNLVVFAFSRSVPLTAFTVVASLLAAPVVHLMLFKRS
jgi:Flp pilus assembly protein TadB